MQTAMQFIGRDVGLGDILDICTFGDLATAGPGSGRAMPHFTNRAIQQFKA